jgi:diguanylate cyclase (GGDEF)-like protein
MYKVLLSALCLVLFSLLFVLAPLVSAQTAAIAFTADEMTYIRQSPRIKMCVDPDWVPFERITPDGKHEGIAADLVQLVAQRVGLRIELYPVKNWDESLAASKAGRCQIMSFLNQSVQREMWLGFTTPIFEDPNILVAREEHPFVGDLRGLTNEVVVLPRGTMVEERIRSEFPNLRVVLTSSENEAVDMVSSRKADLTVRSLIVAAYAIKKEGLFNLKIAGQVPQLTNQLRIGVLKDETLLLSILDKGVRTITPQEREAISNQHVAVNVQQGIDYQLFWKVLAVAALLLLMVFYWNRKLSRLNRKLEQLAVTDQLTGLYNRLKIDQTLNSEIQRAQRTGQPLSLMMLDLDYFKQINDVFGHQAGDQALLSLAELLHVRTREIDLVGRWGGEEFIIICPHTTLEGALTLAESVRATVAAHRFAHKQDLTVSIGVSNYGEGDSGKDLVARADAALYMAKHAGRNQVKVQSKVNSSKLD